MERDGASDQRNYDRLLSRFGGLIERDGLSPDSGLGAALKLGDDAVSLARERLADAGFTDFSFRVGVAQKPILNAAVTSLGSLQAITLFWPLPLTLQGVSAAIWANPGMAPWVGDISALQSPSPTPAMFPPGFDLYLAMLEKAELDPSLLRSGIRKDYINAIVAAGDERWDAFLATFMAAIDFVWRHEVAHVLYGHTEVALRNFGISDLYEAPEDLDRPIPDAMSQFMEYVADMDAGLNIFSSYYGRLLEQPSSPASPDQLLVGAASALGMVVAMYVLAQSAELADRSESIARTHPPAGHRTLWVLSAEALAADEMLGRFGLEGDETARASIAAVRSAAIKLLQSAGGTHPSLHKWVMALNEEVEARTDSFLKSLHAAASPYFELLDRYQLVRRKQKSST